MSAAERLESWKQIARYLHRSVRTVRRWEQVEGLPVRRHQHRAAASVFAVKAEVDAWRESQARAPSAAQPLREPSIAVLPFVNLSAAAPGEYFAEGLTEEITTTLSRVPALRVVSRTSAMTLRGSTKKARAVARLLGVRYLLQGSVRRSGRRMRVCAQLIDAHSDVHLWAETFDGAIDDVFAIQERLARLIVEALALRLTSRDAQRIAERSIDNIAAYECYLRARYEGWRWRKDAIDHAVQLLKEGLRIIGDNARLFAALGLTYLQYREAGIDLGPQPLAQAEACAVKLFALDRNSASGWQLRGWIGYSRGHLQEAVQDLKAALATDPNNCDTLLLLCNCYIVCGQVPAARPLLKRLAALDPLTPVTRCMPAFADIMEGKLARALKPYRAMFEMDRSNPMARLFYAWVLLMNRRRADAEALVTDCPVDLRGTLPVQIMRFLTLAAAGKVRQAQGALTAQIEAAGRATDVFARFLAEGFAYAGQPEAAVRCLHAAIERGFINHAFLARHDPAFKTLRTDPRFQELLRGVHRRWEAFQA